MTETGSTSQESDLQSLKLVLGVYILIFAIKLAVYFMTGVLALFAEALHTLSDIFVSGFLLLQKGTPIEEADRISEEVRERVHKEVKGGYCVIHVDAAGIL